MRIEIDALAAKVMDNRTLLAQSRANIEQNRMLVMSNYVAAMAGNHQLATHNMQEIFGSRTSIFERMDYEDEGHRRYIEAARERSELDLLGHTVNLNRKNLELNQKMVTLNQQLIAINEEIMQLNQEMLEFNEENLSSNVELMSGALHPLLVDETMVSDLIEENEKSLAELQSQADENRQTVIDLLTQSKANRSSALSNSEKISERKQSLYKNREDISEMREKIGTKASLTDLFLGDLQEEE